MKRMIQGACFIAGKEAFYLLRGWEALLWIVLMPVIFFFFIGTVTSGFGSSGESRSQLTLVVEPDAGLLSDELVRRFEEHGFVVEHASSAAEAAKSRQWMAVPSGFTASLLAGEREELILHRTEQGNADRFDDIRARRAAYTMFADVIVLTSSGTAVTAESIRDLRARARSVELAVTRAGVERRAPSGFEHAIPGILVMFTLIVCLTGGTVPLVQERERGLLRRLASTPLTRGQIVLGKWLGRMILALVQISVALAAGTILFGMKWGSDLPMVLVVLLAWGAFCASLGLLLGNVARSVGQAVGIGVLSANMLAALGGCWWPIEITPSWLQALARALPTGWTMEAMHLLISFQAGASSVIANLASLLVAAAAVGWLSARTFRYQ